MADRNSYRITARAEGKGQKTFDFGEKTLHINADENTVYQFEEVGMSSIPDNIVFSRKGNDLWIMPEGQDKPQAIIEGYFSAKNATFGAMGVDGSLYSYGIEDLKSAVSAPNVAAVEHTLATEVSSASEASSTSGASSGLSIPVVSTAALALGGIAVAAGSGSHSSASDDKNHPKNTNHSAEKSTASHEGQESSTPEVAAVKTDKETPLYANNQHQPEQTQPLGVVEEPETKTEVESIVTPSLSTEQEIAFVDVTRVDENNSDIPPEYQGQRADYYGGRYNHAPDAPNFVELGNLVRGQVHAGDLIARVHAYDADNDQVRYYLEDNSGMYAINSYTGQITLTYAGANAINQGRSLPDLKVIAHDGYTTSATSVLKFSSEETHQPAENHAPERPTFHDSATSFVKGQAHEGDQVTTVHANDPENDQVTYYLQGSSRDIYDINHYTGVVTLTKAGADWVNAGRNLPNVEVIAYDGQTPSASASLDVVNTSSAPVQPVNHAPELPTFENVADFSSGYAWAGKVVAITRSHDADGDNLNYYLINNSNRFYDINVQTGVITLTQAGANHVNSGGELPELRILAADGKSYSPIATLDLSQHHGEVNHAPTIPTFENSTNHFVQGQTSAGTHVANAHATDTDGDKVTYYLANNHGGMYAIDRNTGEITLTEKGASHVNAGHNLPDVEVIAYDGKESSAVGRLNVADTSSTPVIDNPPTEPESPTVLPTPTQEHHDPQFHADSTFVDSRELANVEKPYFIDILDHGGGNFGYIRNVWSGYGNGATISYKFSDSAHDEGISWGNNRYSFNVTGFQQYSAEHKQAVRDAIALYEEQTNLKFVEKQSWETANFKFYLDDLKSDKTFAYNRAAGDDDLPQRADSIQASSNAMICPCCGKSLSEIASEGYAEGANAQGISFKAGYAWYGGDVHLNSTIYNGQDSLSKDTAYFEMPGHNKLYTAGGFGVVMHELGHSVGLDHLFSRPDLIQQYSHEDKTALSIMSYTNDLQQTVRHPGYRPMSQNVTATNFGIFDLATLHYRYGVNKSQHAGDSTYTFKHFNPNALGNDIYIWDGSGVDTFDGSQESMNLHINLTPGSWIYRGNHKADTLVYDQSGNIVENQMFIGFGTQIENLKGGRGHDELTGNEANNHIEGGAGNDFIDGGAGNDWLEGGAGNDRLLGGDGDDILNGGEGRDSMNGGAGNDTYYVDNYGDQITDSSGVDTVYSSIDYTLGRGLENLYLTGNANLSGNGNDSDNILWGNAGDNHLSGGYGNDTLYGGAGDDVLSGGAGSDNFIIDGLGLDTLLDFNAREGDVIQLDHNVFINLDLGQVNADNFVSGANAKAQDYNDHLIYNTANNTLYYDADGSGSQAAIAIAKFADNFNDEITANNFRVI